MELASEVFVHAAFGGVVAGIVGEGVKAIFHIESSRRRCRRLLAEIGKISSILQRDLTANDLASRAAEVLSLLASIRRAPTFGARVEQRMADAQLLLDDMARPLENVRRTGTATTKDAEGIKRVASRLACECVA